MSPEQANLSSFDIDARTDVYSLGVILYELLTGSTPLDKDTLADHAIHQLLEFIRDKDPPRPSHRLSSSVESVEISEQRQVPQSRLQEILRSDLDWVVMKAIEKDRNRRYTTPSDLGNDLARFLEGESVVARPPTTGYLLQKYVRKHKVLVATAAAFLALLTSAIIGITNYAIKADRSRREMQVVARRTQGVLDIVTDSFGAIDPNAGSDASMSAKDVLLEARKILAESDLDDEGRMELLNRLGETLFALTEFEESVDVREQLLELCKKHYGDSHQETVDAMTELGSSYRGVGKIAEAIQLQEAALDIYRTEFGEKNPLLIGKLNSLGTSYHSNGQPAKAVTVFEEMVALSVETQGEDHFDTVSSRMQLATVYQEAGRVEEAVPMLVKAEEYFRTNFGKDNLKRLVVLNNLAYGKRMVGSPEEAVPLLEEATQIMRKKFGDEDANTLGTMKCLGFAYCESSQNDKAIPIFEETLELCRAKDGEKGSSTNALRRHLAHAYEVEGRVEDALLLVKEALNINKEAAGEDWSFFVLQSQYGGLQLKRGRIEESSKLLADSYDGMQRFADQVDPNVVKQQMPHAIRRLIKLAEAQEDLEKVSHWTKLLAEY